jgi:hypothetical protein
LLFSSYCLSATKFQIRGPAVIIFSNFFLLCRFLGSLESITLQAGYDVLAGYMSPVHSAYGKVGLATNGDRLRLTEAAVESSDWIMVDSWELAQPSYTRTLPVLKSLQSRLYDILKVSEVQSAFLLTCAIPPYVHITIDLYRSAATFICEALEA